jgi:hypothetical protein
MSRYEYDGDFYDNGKAELTCDLCGNTGLRYHFKLRQVDDGFILWVGSECILKFAPQDYARAETDKKQLIDAAREEGEYFSLFRLAMMTNYKFDFRAAYATYGALTPRQMLLLCRIFKDAEEDVGLPPKVCLRKKIHQAQYRAFSDTERGLVYPHLSPAQQARWMFGI